MSDTPPVIGQNPWGEDLNAYLATLAKPDYWAWVSPVMVLSDFSTPFPFSEPDPPISTPLPEGWLVDSQQPGSLVLPPGIYQISPWATATGSSLQTGVRLRANVQSATGSAALDTDLVTAGGTATSHGTLIALGELMAGVAALGDFRVENDPEFTEPRGAMVGLTIVRLGDA